jgi:hypothetical protein
MGQSRELFYGGSRKRHHRAMGFDGFVKKTSASPLKVKVPKVLN